MPVEVEAEGKDMLLEMKWGFVPFWAKDPRIGYSMINARSESISKKPAFSRAFKSSRCLVPANGFYEWQKQDSKQPYYFHLRNRKIFKFAGLYDVWTDAEGHDLKTYTIITTEANESVGKIHDRMPVILDEEDERKWLSLKTDEKELYKLLDPYNSSQMIFYPVAKDVNYPANEGDHLLIPAKTEGRFK